MYANLDLPCTRSDVVPISIPVYICYIQINDQYIVAISKTYTGSAVSAVTYQLKGIDLGTLILTIGQPNSIITHRNYSQIRWDHYSTFIFRVRHSVFFRQVTYLNYVVGE